MRTFAPYGYVEFTNLTRKQALQIGDVMTAASLQALVDSKGGRIERRSDRMGNRFVPGLISVIYDGKETENWRLEPDGRDYELIWIAKGATMTMAEFIDANREELISRIMGGEPSILVTTLDDDEIENWILNDEGLYDWAISEGVDVYKSKTFAPPDFRKARAKNPCGKMREPDNPYEIWESADGTWKWYVLKKWQIDDDKPYARWFCLVKTPFVPEGEMRDVYVAEIKNNARMTYQDPVCQAKPPDPAEKRFGHPGILKADTAGIPNLVDKIMAYEGGEMTEDEMVAFFQELVDSGLAWNLQGHYGRTAAALIDAGLVTRN